MAKTAVKAVDKYKVLVRVWHTGDTCYYDAGAKVTMAHLADFQIERLIAQGVIEPVKKAGRRPQQEA